jgi:hypothetical protein
MHLHLELYLANGVELVAVLDRQRGKGLEVPLCNGFLHLENPNKVNKNK